MLVSCYPVRMHVYQGCMYLVRTYSVSRRGENTCFSKLVGVVVLRFSPSCMCGADIIDTADVDEVAFTLVSLSRCC